VYLFDGTTVTMPDTPANQAAYPQVYNLVRMRNMTTFSAPC
jgi:hypothetical protein